MPVDKFGRTDVGATQKVATAGVSLSQASNVFLRRDGANEAEGDLNMGGFSIKGLPATSASDDEAVSLAQVNDLLSAVVANNAPNPTRDYQLANKKYVDDLHASLYVTATPTMSSNETTINGLTYVASASEYLIEDPFAFEPWRAFQNKSSFLGWKAAIGRPDYWIQMKYPIALAMSGVWVVIKGLEATGVMKVQSSNDGNIFTDMGDSMRLLSPEEDTTLRFQPQVPLLVGGVLFRCPFPDEVKYSYLRFCISMDRQETDQPVISMLQWIPTLTDKHLRKCHVGYVPRLTSNTSNCGFTASASSELGTSKACSAFREEGEWTVRDSSNSWIYIRCPTPVRIWKVGLRGRNNNAGKILDWRIDGSNNSEVWFTLYIAPDLNRLDNVYREFFDRFYWKISVYRLYCLRAEAGVSGLSVMQLFVYDH